MTAAERRFVLGCQRSGTTLMRLLLDAHPLVASVDEAIAYPVLAGRQDLLAAMPAADGRPFAVFKIPRLAEQLLEPDARDEAYGTFPAFYHGEPAVHLVRDPRDVVASMRALRASTGRSWIATYGPATIRHRIRERPGFADAYAAELDLLERHDWADHIVAAFYWRLKNDPLPRYLDAGLPVLPLRYESLVAEPERVLRRALAHLQIPFDAGVLRHHEVEHGQLDEQGRAIGGSDPERPIDGRSVGRHAAELSASMRTEVDDLTAATRERIERLLGP